MNLPTKRSAALLLHITSFPGGNLRRCKEVVDLVKASGMSAIQVLPLGTPDSFGSPYSSANEGVLNPAFAPGGSAENAYAAFKQYANKNGVAVIGDIPFYVAANSADVREHPEQFQLKADGKPLYVAGCAPDYFAKDGQVWDQNPVYNWDQMAKDGFAWWKARFRRLLQSVDIVRVDHFRAFYNYWMIPVGKRAVDGIFANGPREAFFDAIREEFPGLRGIAETLGMFTEADLNGVQNLASYAGFAEIRVALFGINPWGNFDDMHLPRNYSENNVGYIGTHDNATLTEFLSGPATDPKSLDMLRRYLGAAPEAGPDELRLGLIADLYASRAPMVIVSAQDLLGLGQGFRMNEPGTTGPHNWSFQLTEDHMALWRQHAGQFRRLAEESGRG